ncbi:ZIP family metal transporter [Natranaeroarchaeum sulfidigenes]|uniref:Putative divalent heavy-metal cations transporter n=1 Tax=Natranaeroarchaeum sulfidigenes TaxID=2784880 RepID=A0A897MNS3_9EURY|nr:ZIP family metal transporter [Natranaeroarchaeum sulfidigenes]QSG02042.1 putative divalent heavy-metal cations transporter [Natranaeroarchaeum sulfidigenes]
MVSLLEVTLIALAAGCATGIGALPVLITGRISHRTYDGAVGMAAGIMFGAAVFALLVPGLELGGIGEVLGGFLVGGIALLGANRLLPHVHLYFRGPVVHGADDDITLKNAENWRQAVLIAGSITIHNIPEGLAIGIAFASGFDAVGVALAIAIGVQNIPDGFAMAVPADRAGLSKGNTILYTTLSGAVPEPIAAALGFVLVTVVSGLFPAAAGFAAGTMVAVVFREMIPSSHGHGYADLATLTFLTGFGVMLVVDVALAV